MTDPRESWRTWRARRAEELAAPESWLSVIGLVPVEDGRVRVGSAADCAVRLPAGPAHACDLAVRGVSAEWRPAGGAPQALDVDFDGVPSVATTVAVDRFRLFVVERDGRLAVRVKDTRWARERPFAGVACYDFAPGWRLDGRWEALAEPVWLEVPTVTGDLKRKEIAHRAHAVAPDGTPFALLPVYGDETHLLFVFRDRTSGRATYGGGRFLRAARPAGAGIVLDFNRAFNPPCAFTPFATCPLPPPENWLPFAVEAGEQAVGK